jgi:hypothetical protein
MLWRRLYSSGKYSIAVSACLPSKPFIGIPTNSGWMPFAASKGIVSASAVFCHSGSRVMFKADEASIANSMAAIAAAFVSVNVADRATRAGGFRQTDTQTKILASKLVISTCKVPNATYRLSL